MTSKLLTILLFFAFTSINAHAEWHAFSLPNNHIVIDIEFNGHPAKAIIDSGAEQNIVNPTFIAMYGDGIQKVGSIKMSGVVSTETASIYGNIPVKVFGYDVVLGKVMSSYLGDVAMILGRSFFTNSIVQIDYPQKRLRLLSNKAVKMNQVKNIKMRRQRASSLPAVQVKINDKYVWLTLDTGNNGGIFIKRSTAVENDWLTDADNITKGVITGLNNQVNVESFTVDTFAIGPYELENVLVEIPEKGKLVNTSKRVKEGKMGSNISQGVLTKGLIGYDVLKHFVLTIDYSNYRAHIVAP